MGKEKELKTEAPGNAFSRMNYLYQAANLMIETCPQSNHLSNYYIKIMKEISKKVVEKLHPDLKRTLCCSCNCPLTARSSEVNVKLKAFRRKKKKKDLQVKQSGTSYSKTRSYTGSRNKYQKNRINARHKRPNKLWWSCNKCGFSKGFLQKPSCELWIHKIQKSQ